MESPAEAAKQRGNALFGKGKYSAAADAYTEAIVRMCCVPLLILIADLQC